MEQNQIPKSWTIQTWFDKISTAVNKRILWKHWKREDVTHVTWKDYVTQRFTWQDRIAPHTIECHDSIFNRFFRFKGALQCHKDLGLRIDTFFSVAVNDLVVVQNSVTALGHTSEKGWFMDTHFKVSGRFLKRTKSTQDSLVPTYTLDYLSGHNYGYSFYEYQLKRLPTANDAKRE